MAQVSEKRAVRSYIKREGKGFFINTSVWLAYEDGSEEKAFDYYSDELSFYENEFVGKTVSEAISIKVQKDVAYLRS